MPNVSGNSSWSIQLTDYPSYGAGTRYLTQQSLTAIIGASGTASNINAYTYANNGALTLNQCLVQQYSLNANSTIQIDFTSFTDIEGNANTNAARVRVVAAYNSGNSDVKMYAANTNGVGWFPGTFTAPALVRANGGRLLVEDPNSNGANTGNVISGTSRIIVIDPGSSNGSLQLICACSNTA